MKRLVLLFLLLTVISACNHKNYSLLLHNGVPGYPIHIIKDPTDQEHLTLDQAAALIDSYRNQKTLSGITGTIGGFIDREALSPLRNTNATDIPKYNVINFYIGYDTGFLGIGDHIYLSIKKQNIFESEHSVPESLSYGIPYLMSKDEFEYNSSAADTKDFLKNYKPKFSRGSEARDGKEIIKDIYNFQEEFTDAGTSVNQYIACAFVEDELIKLLSSTPPQGQPIGLRYYLGYDKDKPNKICLILIGVDPDGKNMLDAGILLFEHSWPPPPH